MRVRVRITLPPACTTMCPLKRRTKCEGSWPCTTRTCVRVRFRVRVRVRVRVTNLTLTLTLLAALAPG